MEELLPCPCGTPGFVDVHRRTEPGAAYWVRCRKCERTGPEAKTEAAAVNGWNGLRERASA